MQPRTASSAKDAPDLKPLIDGIQKIFLGKPEATIWAVVTLISRGHLLIEDVPGIGKTLLAQALARSVDASFRRIQFTNDLLPSDILGLSILNATDHSFEFKPGPIFSHIVLTDEINRATPKTQSALLEAMNELQVTIDGRTHALPEPFMVVATQNPIEYHGTFPLPEAQLDRFLMRIRIGYPEADDEKAILQGGDPAAELHTLRPCLSTAQVLALQKKVEEIRMDDSLVDYVVAIARKTRTHKSVRLGLSPRGAMALSRAAKAFALVSGRDFVIPDDVKRVAVPVMSHRLLIDTNLYGMPRIEESERFVEELLTSVAAP
ncbi:MAG: MoxR family ATPase [Elusimicrobia bacterium]|nr:MoxR family ATPase [Elusimicrobiota bacterium]